LKDHYAMSQLDFFESSPPSSAPPPSTSSIIGLRVKLPRVCRCGSYIATIGSSSGPHEHRLDCAQCGTWCQWLGRNEAVFIAGISEKFGAPSTPIVLRTRVQS